MAKPTPPAQAPSAVAELPVPPGKKASDYLTAYKGTAYACINAISQDVSNIRLKLYRRKGNEIKEVEEHEALSLLRYVNDFSTMYDLFEATQIFMETSGESFWLFLRDTKKRIAEIWVLRPDWMTVLPSKSKVIKGYKYRPGGMHEELTFEPEDILHFKYFNPARMTRGKGTVQAAAMEIDLDDFSANYTRNFFFNSAVPNLLIKFKKNLTTDQINQFITQWESKFRGQNQSHKVAAIGGDVETEHLNDDLTKMGLVEQRKYARDSIMSIFKVPKSIIGITEDVNRANAEATVRAYMERVIDPKMQKLVVQLNEFYLPNWGDDLFFDYESPVPQDEDLKLRTYKSGLGGEGLPWMTINEVRDMENLPPVSGGDVIYIPFGMQAQNGEEKGIFGGKTKWRKVRELKLRRTKKAKSVKTHLPIPTKKLQDIRAEAEKKNVKIKVKKILSLAVKETEKEIQREGYWLKLIARTDVWEGLVVDKLFKLFDAQESYVTGQLGSKKAWHTKTDIARFLFDLVSENAKWSKELEPVIAGIIQEQGREALTMLGLTSDIDMSQKRVTDYLKEFSGDLIKGINEVTLDRLRNELSEGVSKDESVPELKGRVETVFTSAKGARSEKIARTEVLRASNFGSREGYKQSGVIKKMEWLTALDDRTCPICQPMNGKQISMRAKFDVNGAGRIDHPPAHPNCRCTIIPILNDEE